MVPNGRWEGKGSLPFLCRSDFRALVTPVVSSPTELAPEPPILGEPYVHARHRQEEEGNDKRSKNVLYHGSGDRTQPEETSSGKERPGEGANKAMPPIPNVPLHRTTP